METDLAGIERLVNPRTKAFYVETPTNPTLRLVDLQKAVAFAKEWALVSIIDNTFATPVLQKPLAMGFNMVVHSATKYLAGHSDVIAGAAAGSKALMQQGAREHDLPGRLDGSRSGVSADSRDEDAARPRGSSSARTRWKWRNISKSIPRWRGCIIQGLPSHPDHKLAKRQMRGFGAMLALRYEGRPGGCAAILRSGARFPAGGEPWAGWNHS